MRPKKPMSFHTLTSTMAGMAQFSSSSQPGPSTPKKPSMPLTAPYWGESMLFHIMLAATQLVRTGM